MERIEVQYMKIGDLIPYENNPRINEAAIEKVANSIKEFGFKVPIVVDEDNVIITGHTRLKASILLKMDEVPVIVAKSLSEAKIKAFRLADNKTGELAKWNNEMLDQELNELFDVIDMNDFGFPVQIEDIDEDELGENPIGAELGEANNYVVLQFNDELDWEKAIAVLGIEKVTTGETNKNIRRHGTGRVLEGKEIIERLAKNE